jgi:hypothetical protein
MELDGGPGHVGALMPGLFGRFFAEGSKEAAPPPFTLELQEVTGSSPVPPTISSV